MLRNTAQSAQTHHFPRRTSALPDPCHDNDHGGPLPPGGQWNGNVTVFSGSFFGRSFAGRPFPQHCSSASTQKILPGSTSLRSVTARPDVFCFRPLPLPPDQRRSRLSISKLRAVSRQWCRQDHRMPLPERRGESSSPAPFARAKSIATRPGRPSGSLRPLRMEGEPD